jgi:serine phosphatase RsbU (regulator of sigma subunit)
MTTPALAEDGARVRALEAIGVSASEPEERFDRITRVAQQLFCVSIATVSLIDETTLWYKSRQGIDVPSVPRDEAFCDHTIRAADSLVVEDLSRDDRFAGHPFVTAGPEVRFYAGHPLQAPGGHRVGTLCLIDEKPRRFGATERALLVELAHWAEAELTRAAELDRAAEVQRGLLPRLDMDVPGYSFAGICLPSRAVGGDFIDWYRLPDGSLVLTLADVMGKGIGAAIMMATVRAAMRTAGRLMSPAEAVRQAAISLDQDLQQTSTLVTLLHARLVPESGEYTWTDAGHGLLLVVRADGTLQRSPGHGLPLGTLPDEHWAEQRIVLHPGDTLVAFSDGLLDLYDGTLAALDEVVRVVRAAPDPASVIAHFAGIARGRPLPDDLTVVAARRN